MAAQRTELGFAGLLNPATFAGAVVVTVVSGLIVAALMSGVGGAGKRGR